MAVSLQTPEKIRTLPKKLYRKAKAEGRRGLGFYEPKVSLPLWVLR